MSLDQNNTLAPADHSMSSKFSRKLSPTSRLYSPVKNYQSSLPPPEVFKIESPIKDRTPLLPICSQNLRRQQSISESPLTLGKKSSYGLFIPPYYSAASPEHPPTSPDLGYHITYGEVDEEASSL